MATKYTDDGRIKRPNKKINFTKNMVLEFAKCAQDVIYFAETYYKIIHPVQGAQIVKLRDYQKRMLKGFVENQMNVVLSSRQSGKCVHRDTNICIKDTYDNNIKNYTIKDFFNLISNDTEINNLNYKLNFIEDSASLKKFDKVLYIPERYLISTPQGWKPVTSIMLTVPFYVWHLILENGMSLKCADTHIVYTQNHKSVYAKDLKQDDLIETTNGYIPIKSITKLDIPPENMYDITVDSHEHEFYSNNITSHNTTCSAIYILWFCCFQKDKTVAIVANKASTSKSILEEIKYAWEFIPEFLKPGVKEYNAFSVTFDNECKIIAKATTPDCLRGEAISLLFADEFAFLPSHIADPFWTANYPTLATGGKCIIVSTPNGTGNLFYDIWKQAIDKQGLFNPIKVDWWEVPGRDEIWKEKTIKTIGMIKFAQEFGNQFQGSSVTLIEADFIINKLHKTDPQIVPDDYTHMWEQKKPGHIYCIIVDIGGGVGSDFSVINVFDITAISKGGPAIQVAIWRCNTIPPPKMAEFVLASARYWNNAYVVLETNPGGYGDDVQKDLFEKYDYENLYFDVERGEYGILWTKANKPKACQDFKKDLENQRIIIHDSETIDEIGYFEEQSPGVFKSKQGKNLHDDCVMTCVGFAHFLNSEFFQGELFEIEQNSMKKKDPEAWYQTNNTTPDETPLDDTTSEDEDAWDAFIAADHAENDPENWLQNDEVNYFIRNKQKNGTLNQYIDKQRNFHKK